MIAISELRSVHDSTATGATRAGILSHAEGQLSQKQLNGLEVTQETTLLPFASPISRHGAASAQNPSLCKQHVHAGIFCDGLTAYTKINKQGKIRTCACSRYSPGRAEPLPRHARSSREICSGAVGAQRQQGTKVGKIFTRPDKEQADAAHCDRLYKQGHSPCLLTSKAGASVPKSRFE